jgi:hypothetical protein
MILIGDPTRRGGAFFRFEKRPYLRSIGTMRSIRIPQRYCDLAPTTSIDAVTQQTGSKNMKRMTVRLSLATVALAAALGTAHAQAPDPQHPAGMDATKAMPSPMAPPQAAMPMGGQKGGGPMAAGRGNDGMGRMMEMMHPMMGERGAMGMPFEHVEGRIAYLKAELKITDAQAAAWSAFADTMRADATAMKAMHDDMAKSGMPATTPERMMARRQMMTTRMSMMERSEMSVKALYAALSVDQRKAFDQMMSGLMGMM